MLIVEASRAHLRFVVTSWVATLKSSKAATFVLPGIQPWCTLKFLTMSKMFSPKQRRVWNLWLSTSCCDAGSLCYMYSLWLHPGCGIISNKWRKAVLKHSNFIFSYPCIYFCSHLQKEAPYRIGSMWRGCNCFPQRKFRFEAWTAEHGAQERW